MNKKVVVGLVVVLALALVLGRGFLFQAFQVNNPSFILATGTYSSPNPVDVSGTARIAGYTISITSHSTYNYYTGSMQCKSNSCGGTQTGTDADGCPLYTAAATSAFYQCESVGGCCSEPAPCIRYTNGQICAGAIGSCGGSIECSRLGVYQWTGCTYHASTTPTCGGMDKTLQTSAGCGIAMTVTNSSGKVYDSGTAWLSTLGTVNLQGILIVAPVLNSFNQLQNCVYQLVSVTPVIPSDSFDIDITPQQSSYFQGDNATIGITITSNFSDLLTANVVTTVCAPSFAGQTCQDYPTQTTIIKGVNHLSHSIPTAAVTDKLTVKTTATVYYNVASLSGLNVNCGAGLQTASGCASKVQIASVSSDTKTVMINPQPIYLTDRDCVASGCPSQYSCNSQSKLCVRNDVKDLSCVQLGCPNTAGHTYACTSAGVCAETVTLYQDCTSRACPSGTTCDALSGVCINTVIFNEVVQCTTGTDCMQPCSGVTANCISNRCSYNGQCTPTVIQCFQTSDCPTTPCLGVTTACNSNHCSITGSCAPVYVNVDCSTASCPTGYTCDTSFVPPVCKNTTTYSLDCSTLGCPRDYTCEDVTSILGLWTSKVCVKTNTIYVPIDCLSTGQTCPTGYQCETAGMGAGLCKKTEFINQNCLTLGCPAGYQCEADGTCTKSQTIYVIQNCNTVPCPSDYLCQPTSGLCIKSEHIHDTCQTLSCPSGYDCDTTGVCTRTMNQTVYVQMNCSASFCPQGYQCSAQGDFCLNTQYKSVTCQDVGCPSNYQCEATGICSQQSVYTPPAGIPSWQWIAVMLIVVVLAIAVVVVVRR